MNTLSSKQHIKIRTLIAFFVSTITLVFLFFSSKSQTKSLVDDDNIDFIEDNDYDALFLRSFSDSEVILVTPVATPTQFSVPTGTSTIATTIDPTTKVIMATPTVAPPTLSPVLSPTPTFSITPTAMITSPPSPTITTVPTFTATPEKPPSVGLIITSYAQFVEQNQDANVSISAIANLYCEIIVTLPSGSESGAKGLEPGTTDENGVFSWEWRVNWNTKPGIGTIKVKCPESGESVEVEFEITER